MSRVRVLVGTRKGAFVLTSDGKRKQWDVSRPHFGGWELYHVKGSPVDPNRQDERSGPCPQGVAYSQARNQRSVQRCWLAFLLTPVSE